MIFLPIAGGGGAAGPTVIIFCMLVVQPPAMQCSVTAVSSLAQISNHAYQILSRSRQGLRSYGGPKSGFSYSFLNRSYNNVSHYRATL